MSIIVYGPQGCGKPLAAPLLKRAFNLDVTWDGFDYVDRPLYSRATRSLPDLDGVEPYDWARQHPDDFKAARILFLTHALPPYDLRHARRIVSFVDALDLAVNMGIRTYLADWPRAQAIESITARSILEAVGVVPQLQSKPLFGTVNRVMTELGWNRVRLRAAGEPVTWAYQPALKEAA